MESKTRGQWLVIGIISAIFVICSFAFTGYLYAQEAGTETSEAEDDYDFWNDESLWSQEPISDVFDERLNERSDDWDHQIDITAYAGSQAELSTQRAAEDASVLGQQEYTGTMERFKSGDTMASIQVFDPALGKEYQLTRQTSNATYGAGDTWSTEEIVRDADGNVQDRIAIPVGGEGPNLHAEGLTVNVAFIKPGQTAAEAEWGQSYKDVTIGEINRLASDGRTDTSNAFGVYADPEPGHEPLQVTSVRVQPLPDTRTVQEKMSQEFMDAVNPDPYHGVNKAIDDVGNILRDNMIVVEGVDPNNPGAGRTVITGQTNAQGGSDIRTYTPQGGLQFYDPSSGQLSKPTPLDLNTPQAEPIQPLQLKVYDANGNLTEPSEAIFDGRNRVRFDNE
ncbi:MAG: hypothetical protein PHN59_01665 [Candidatus Omnitrophica bacterium]|nr:hypothetical protein [Candidatus Omnitrophota bacterium]